MVKNYVAVDTERGVFWAFAGEYPPDAVGALLCEAPAAIEPTAFLVSSEDDDESAVLNEPVEVVEWVRARQGVTIQCVRRISRPACQNER